MLDITDILQDTEGVGEEVLQDAIRLLEERQRAQLAFSHERLRLAQMAGGGERRNFKDGYTDAMWDPASYHYWGQRLGYECWADKQFMKEFLRDNPVCRVKSVSSKIQVGWLPTRPRFHKKYAEAAA